MSEENQVQARLQLANFLAPKRERVWKAIVYSMPGVGKSSFAALAPNPVFISPLENRLSYLNVHGLPLATRYMGEPSNPDDISGFINQLKLIANSEHDFKTLVIDSVSGLGELIKDHVLRTVLKDGGYAKSLEDYGWGSGYSYAIAKWQEVLKWLDYISASRNMNIMLCAHAVVKTYKPPVGEEYNIYSIDAFDQKNNSAVKALMAWADFVFFMQLVAVTVEETKGVGRMKKTVTKALDVDAMPTRALYTQSRSAFEAKNSNVAGMDFMYEIEGDSGRQVFELMK